MYLEFSRHSKNSTALSKQRKKIESQDMKGTPSLKMNTIPNGKILGSILNLTRKRETSLKTIASFFIMETTIGNITSTIPNPRNSKAKQGTRQKKNQESRKTRKEIDDEILSSTEEFRMIIDIPTSSDSEETKYPEDNTNYVWQTVRTKRTKKKAPDTKRGKKGIENFRNFKKNRCFQAKTS